MRTAFGVFFERKLFNRVRLGAVGHARQVARHGEANILGVVGIAQPRQAAYSVLLKIFVRSRGLASSCQEFICMIAGDARR